MPKSALHIYRNTRRGGFSNIYLASDGKALKDAYQWEAKSQWKGSPLMSHKKVAIKVDPTRKISAIVRHVAGSKICFVMAHGAGAGMTHHFMEAVASGLENRSITTLRYQFPYMEEGRKRPDQPAVAHTAVRAAVADAARRFPRLVLIAGGKSFGGRMTSQTQSIAPLPGISGLAFFGFPLHPAGKVSDARGAHLSGVKVPMLFLQGTRDKLADLMLLQTVSAKLGKRATLVKIPDADHGFHVPARSGKTDEDVMEDLLDAFAGWAKDLKRPRITSGR